MEKGLGRIPYEKPLKPYSPTVLTRKISTTTKREGAKMGKLTYGAGIWAFGQFVDRYAGDGYGPTRTSQQMIEDAAKVPGLKHLDINVPFDIPERTAVEIKKMLDDNGLICRATTPHIYMR